MRILVVIVTHNGIKYIEKCLKNLIVSKFYIDIIVIDNYSTDGTSDFIKTNFPNIKIIQINKNIGFGRANNIGLSIALEKNMDFTFLLNQDCWLDFECLEKLVDTSLKVPEFGLLSPLHLTGSGEKLDYAFVEYIKHTKDNALLHDLLVTHSLKNIYELPFVNAASWLITRKCLEEVGGFNPAFYHYGEDDNYCHRMKYHGFKIGVVPSAIVYHDREDRLKDDYWVKKWENEFVLSKRKLVLAFSDINNKVYPFRYIFLLFRKIFTSFFTIQIKKSYLYVQLFLFIIYNLSFIIKNRNQSKKKYPSWICQCIYGEYNKL